MRGTATWHFCATMCSSNVAIVM
eukprot:SAG31_NODE_27323_length_427_cov_15.362805_1_plen_22_part_10